jgi:hypothetical protein
MESIEIPALSDMERLSIAQSRLAELKAEQKKWQEEYDSAMENVLVKATFAEDKFLSSLKKKGDSYREGDYKLLRMAKVTRKIDAKKFAATFPEIAASICSIPVGKAETLVGKANLDAFCEHTTSYSCEVVDMRNR